MPRIYDVSLSIREDMIVYPNNPKPSIKQYSMIPKDKVNESAIHLGSHTGTHVDSKRHIMDAASGVEELPLDSFYGNCKVIDLTHLENEVQAKDLQCHDVKRGDIILLKTKNSIRGYRKFREDFIHVSFDAARFLVEVGVKTLGFDYLSVKKFGGDQEVHEVLINNLTLFEGLDLAEVPEGEYTFVGLPLPISCDGAPSRVILIEKV